MGSKPHRFLVRQEGQAVPSVHRGQEARSNQLDQEVPLVLALPHQFHYQVLRVFQEPLVALAVLLVQEFLCRLRR